MNANLKERIIYLMNTYGTPQKFLSDLAGTSKTTIHLWLSGKRDLPDYSVKKLNEWLNSLN